MQKGRRRLDATAVFNEAISMERGHLELEINTIIKI